MRQTVRAYYYAIGEYYARMAEVSAASLRRHCPDLPITLFTDQPVAAEMFDEIIPIAKRLRKIYSIKKEKILCFRKIHSELGIFLDCDTFVTADITPLFTLMQSYDIAVAYDVGRHTSQPFGTDMNSGVIVFNNNARTRRLWRTWRRQFETSPLLYSVVRDQPAFDRALRTSAVRMFVLAPEFNLRLPPLGAQIAGKVKIFHGPPQMVHDGSIADLAEFINSEDGIRAFDWQTGQMRIHEITGVAGNDHTTAQRTRTYVFP